MTTLNSFNIRIIKPYHFKFRLWYIETQNHLTTAIFN